MNKRKIARKESIEVIKEKTANFPLKLDSNWLKKIKAPRKVVIPLLVIIFLVGLGYFFKDKLLVATVNGQPIFRYELNKRLTSTYGKETLENLIVEKLIAGEVAKKKVKITSDEIEREITNLTKSLGEGVNLEDVLKFQGMTMEDFRNQIKMRLEVNKLLENEVSVSEAEIDQFLKDNASSLTATDEAERKIEATAKIREQKMSALVQQWVQDLLDKGQINRFLK